MQKIIAFQTRHEKNLFIHLLTKQGYTSHIGNDPEKIIAGNNHEHYPKIAIYYNDKRFEFTGALTDLNWPQDASKILELLSSQEYKLKLTDDYDAILDVSKQVVNVGCQQIPFEKIKALNNMIVVATSK